MLPNEYIETIKKDLQKETKELHVDLEIRRSTLVIDPSDIVKVGEYLFSKLGCRLVTATAVDEKKNFEIYYHFSHDKTGMVTHVHVFLPKEKPEIDTLAYVTTAADWIEREMHELFGINFKDHPNMEPLLSEGNWGPDEFPFRKNED